MQHDDLSHQIETELDRYRRLSNDRRFSVRARVRARFQTQIPAFASCTGEIAQITNTERTWSFVYAKPLFGQFEPGTPIADMAKYMIDRFYFLFGLYPMTLDIEASQASSLGPLYHYRQHMCAVIPDPTRPKWTMRCSGSQKADNE